MAGGSKKESPVMSPHASSTSSSSVCALLKNWSVEVLIRTGGEAVGFRACRWSVDVNDELEGIGRALTVLAGVEEGRSATVRSAALLVGFACMSPLVDVILFVKEDMAQPAHDVSVCGVPIRGVSPLAELALGGGRTVSGNEFPYFRTRLT